MRLDQVPAIAPQILENDYAAIWLLPRRFHEAHAAVPKTMIIAVKIGRLEKQENSSATLIADRRLLPRSYGTRQQEARWRAARRSDFYPALRTRQMFIRYQFKAKPVDEIGDGTIVVVHHEGN